MIKVFVVQASRSEFRFPELTLMLGGLDAMLVGPALKNLGQGSPKQTV